ncbi:MAG: hypothetical protein ACI4QR_07025 [Eubacteriales bacterium]
MKKEVFFNEDPNHFVIERMRAGKTAVTKDDIFAFIDQYKNTSVTDFLVCLNASSCWYPSKRTDNIIEKYKVWRREHTGEEDENTATWGARLMTEIYESGLELHKLWIERLRQDGIRPWISIRMNDIHGSSNPGDFLNCDMVNSHPEYCRTPYRTPVGYYDHALDYMRDEVREYYLNIIGEGLETFDTDGIELDFMREIYSVCVGREYEGIEVINDFMRRAYELIKKAEKMRGHKILIAVRMPSNPEICMRLGFDVFTWVEEGLVDYITVTSRWSSTDNNMPIDIWKRIFKDKNVKILAGIEYLLEAYNRRPRKYLSGTLKTDIGSCAAYLGMGADGIYLFNHMDSSSPHPELSEDSISNKGMDRLLEIAGDYDILQNESRRHVVTYHDISAVGAGVIKQLPVTIGENIFSDIRIPTGNIPAGKRVRLIIGINKGADISMLIAFANAVPCRFIGKTERIFPQYDDMEYYAFEIQNDGTLPPVTVAELSAGKGRAVVHWVEIIID